MHLHNHHAKKMIEMHDFENICWQKKISFIRSLFAIRFKQYGLNERYHDMIHFLCGTGVNELLNVWPDL